MGFNQAMQTVSLESLIFVLNLPYSAMIMERVKHFHSLQSWLNQVLKSIEIWTQIIKNLYKYQNLSKYFNQFNKNIVVIPTILSYQKISVLRVFFKNLQNMYVPSIMISSLELHIISTQPPRILHRAYKILILQSKQYVLRCNEYTCMFLE